MVGIDPWLALVRASRVGVHVRAVEQGSATPDIGTAEQLKAVLVKSGSIACISFVRKFLKSVAGCAVGLADSYGTPCLKKWKFECVDLYQARALRLYSRCPGCERHVPVTAVRGCSDALGAEASGTYTPFLGSLLAASIGLEPAVAE